MEGIGPLAPDLCMHEMLLAGPKKRSVLYRELLAIFLVRGLASDNICFFVKKHIALHTEMQTGRQTDIHTYITCDWVR